MGAVGPSDPLPQTRHLIALSLGGLLFVLFTGLVCLLLPFVWSLTLVTGLISLFLLAAVGLIPDILLRLVSLFFLLLVVHL